MQEKKRVTDKTKGMCGSVQGTRQILSYAVNHSITNPPKLTPKRPPNGNDAYVKNTGIELEARQ